MPDAVDRGRLRHQLPVNKTGVCSLRRHYRADVDLPLPLQPDSIEQVHCLRARVIRSLFHLYEPFSLRLSRIPPLPESTPTALLNSKVNDGRCVQLQVFLCNRVKNLKN